MMFSGIVYLAKNLSFFDLNGVVIMGIYPESLKTNGWDLLATNMHEIQKHTYDVAVIPVAATEAHNHHLPEGMDVIHTTYIARQCCERAWEQSPNIVCLPTIPYGVDCNLMDFPLTIHVSQDTLNTIFADIIRSLRTHGIQKIVILNGHGGNNFTSFAREMQCEDDVFVFLCDWWKVGFDQYDDIFDKKDDHGGEMETSIALQLCPDCVDMAVAGEAKSLPFRFEAMKNGWVNSSRRFATMNSDCGVGDPALATAEKGKQYLDLVISRITDFLVELGVTSIDERFPMETE